MKWSDLEKQLFTPEEIKTAKRHAVLMGREYLKPKGRKRLIERVACRQP